MPDTESSIWDKFDVKQYLEWQKDIAAESNSDKAPKQDKSKWDKRRHRAKRISMDVVASLIWMYAFGKLFIGDFDRWIVESVSPSLLWLLDYRFFIFLALFALVVLLARRWTLVIPAAYVLFFPLILFAWKIPRAYYRSGSWPLVIGTVQVLWSVVRSFRFAVLAFTAVALSAVVVSVASIDWLLYAAATVLVIVWLLLLARAVLGSPRPSQFVQAQQGLVSRTLDSEWAWNVSTPDAAIKSTGVVTLNKNQADALVQHASLGVVLYGTGHVWAEQLENYRKSGFSVVFSALSVVALVLQASLLFCLSNLALYRADHLQFDVAQNSDFATFFRYSLNSLFLSEIDSLKPVGTAASWLSTLAGLSIAVIGLVLIVAIVFGVKQSRDDQDTREAIEDMRRRSDAFAHKLTTEYRTSLDDLVNRVLEIGGFIGIWLKFFGSVAGGVRGFEDWESKRPEVNEVDPRYLPVPSVLG